MQAKSERLIVALDVSTSADALRVVSAIGHSAHIFKVGKQLFTAEGPAVVRDLIAIGRKVFLDLKFHDIPNTVAAGVRAAADLNVSMLTVHASGGTRMLQAACEAAHSSRNRPLVLAVTVLTSFTDNDLAETGVSATVRQQVLRMAALAQACGCDGVVSPPGEASELRRLLGPEAKIVTPGIRPRGAAADDQVRISTPAAAIRAGASHIVVGRPITTAADPAGAARSILQEMEEVGAVVCK